MRSRTQKRRGSKQLFLYTNSAPGVAASYSSGEIPALTPFSNTFDNSDLNLRTTFHWDRKQYAALSTETMSSFTANDYRKARMRHWLKATAIKYSPTLSMERAPSPDNGGTIEGQKTWYDYSSKSGNSYIGSQIHPLVVAQVLPDGTTRFTRTPRNNIGWETNQVSTYSVGSTVYLRTNGFGYASNDIDLLTVTNALGVRVISNYFNGNHQVLTNFNALNEMTVFTYDGNSRLTGITLPNGLVTTNIYGSDDYLSQQIDVGLATNSYTWNDALLFTHTDPRGLRITNTWDALERLRRIDFPDGTSISNTYENLDLVRVVDRMGFTNSFGYDAVRQLIAATNANGVVTRYGYCSCGALGSVTNAFGTSLQQATQYTYDLQGNVIQVLYPDSYTLTYNYNALGQATNVTDGTTSVTNGFNNQGLLVAVSNVLGRVQAITFDPLDRATNNVDANGVTITNTFDNLNRLLSRGYPDGGVENYAYTANVVGATSYTNQLGTNAVIYTYDSLGRKTREVYPGIATNDFTYDGAGDLLTLIDGKSQTTTWIYDEYGRATNKVDAANNLLFFYQYDPNHRLTNRWSAAKGNTVYKYDAVGNVTNIDYAVSADITLQYDVLNRLTNMVDAVGTTVYTYNSASQILSEDGPWSSDTVSYTYDSGRRRSGLALLAPNATAWTQSYGYDSANRMTNVTSPAGAFTYAYDATRKLQVNKLTLPNTSYITNAFDSVARLIGTYLKNSGNSVLNSHEYVNNAGNQRTKQTFTTGNYLDYTYDGIGQLKTALGKESGGTTNRLHEQFGYAYDAAGNLNFRTNNALIQVFVVNSLNEVSNVTRSGTLTVAGTTTSPATNVTVNSLTAALYTDYTFARTNLALVDATTNFTAVARDAYGRDDSNTVTVNLTATNTFAYDLNGNLLTNGTRIYIYDDENQLVTNYVAGAWKSEFVYDGQHRRRIERNYTWQSSAWVKTNEMRFVYEGILPIQHRDANNLPVLTLTRGRDLSGTFQGAGGIGGLLAFTEHATVTPEHTYYQADGNGNVTALVSTNQLIAARYLYTSFGDTLSMSGAKADINSYRFSSKPMHSPSGMYDYLLRWYVPELNRWLTQDRIGELGGVNLYGFVYNNPINGVDPLGLDMLDWLDDVATSGYQVGGFWGNTLGDLASVGTAGLNSIGASAVKSLSQKSGCHAGAGNYLSATTYGAATVGVIALNAWGIGKATPNIGQWVKNPALYEIGSATVTKQLLAEATRAGGRTAIGKGGFYLSKFPGAGGSKALWELGKQSVKAGGDWKKTLAEGPTIGGMLGVLGSEQFLNGDNGPCECN